MRSLPRLLLPAAAVLAIAGFVLLPSCNSKESCTFAAVVFDNPFGTSMGQGDTLNFRAVTTSDCPSTIGPAVVFTSSAPGILSLQATSDTTVRVIAADQGDAYLVGAARDRSTVRDSVEIIVGGPNP